MRVIVSIFLLVFCVTSEAQIATASVADSLFATGNYIKAINHYAEDGSITSTLQIARAYNAIGNYEKAISQYQNVLSQDATLQIAKFELGKLYLKTKDFTNAEALFLELTYAASNNPEYHFYLGETFREEKKTERGLASYKNAVVIDSTHLRSLFQLGKYYVGQREKDSALTFIDKGLHFYENDVVMLNLKALAYYNNDEYTKARPYFEKLIALGEHKEYIYEKLAYCYFKEWEFEPAKINYRKVLELNDENADAYFNLGQVFWKDRQIDSAQYYIEESITVQKPFLLREYVALAGIARNNDDMKTALKYYKLAHQEDPEDALVYHNVCTVADQYYKDPKIKLTYYEKFDERFGDKNDYMSKMVNKRISELKEEIHYDVK
ncbi:tetratricopeptide repeat protein [Zobellia sp. B3R18]|uniref:tetratricopeptide repeat protein n=1 Tax=Zobellia sp. B3R18 TaxID=2841568 RepID=UPI001C0658D6|nr:tetratricopeptide repeat protein [Zobellia sp. B3R18]MBU2974395.1 tetratricopeptide repeat protein [Zobellia sp. B3R18]